MANGFNMYPTLTPEKIEEIKYHSEIFEFSYLDDNEDFKLELNELSGDTTHFSARLKDERCVWYPDSKNLIIRKKGKIDIPSALFGENGVAVSDAVIGIAVMWISTKSDHRGIIKCGQFKSIKNAYEYNFDYTFDKSIIKGSLQLQVILYLKKPGTPDVNEVHLNNISGTVYGILDQCEVFTDGTGSVFPIVTVNDPEGPLWKVFYDMAADPMTDAFDEQNVEIRLNRAHLLFESLKIDSSIKESPLFIEVMSSAMLIIVNSVKDSLGSDWENQIASQDFTHGSIAEAIFYFIHKLGWDASSQTALSASIHSYFDKVL